MMSRTTPRLWEFLACLIMIVPIKGAKILLLPMPMYSHCLYISSVGQELASRGHDVAIFLDAKFSHKNCFQRGYNGTNKIRPIMFQPSTGIKGADEIQAKINVVANEGGNLSPLVLMSLFRDMTWHQCAAVFSDQEALGTLENERFDLAIVDGMFLGYCLFVLPYKLGIQYVTLATVIEDFVSMRPSLPSIVPNFMSLNTDKMTFFQRLLNGITPIVFHALIRQTIPMDVISKIAPELSTQGVISLVSNSELFLFNQDTVLGYSVPKMPNHIFVGGVAAQPAAPLTGVFKEIYQNAPDGVVLVTLGSMIGASSKLTKHLEAALKRLNIDVLWKHEEAQDNSKMKCVKWLPQNDLLGHPNTRLFVSHCGNNGIFEALYHGVPIVCTPIGGDQLYNGIRIEKWNVGISVPLGSSSEEMIFNAIYEVFHNATYKANMMRASEIYHSYPENPRERAAFWIEHVLKFGGDHLKSPASDMSVFTYLGYDVLCFVLGFCTLTMVLFIKLISVSYRCCCRRDSSKIKTS